jgi:hypothetical protein
MQEVYCCSRVVDARASGCAATYDWNQNEQTHTPLLLFAAAGDASTPRSMRKSSTSGTSGGPLAHSITISSSTSMPSPFEDSVLGLAGGSSSHGRQQWAQGGTGGKTPADARAGIGLGPTAFLAIGGIEITAAAPYIDFHFNNTATDYDVRLVNSAAGTLNALVTNPNEFRINGATVWNDSNVGTKLGSIAVGGVGSYGFFLTNTGLTPGATIAGGNLQYAFATGNGQTSPTGLWRCMGDTTAGQRTLFQRVS